MAKQTKKGKARKKRPRRKTGPGVSYLAVLRRLSLPLFLLLLICLSLAATFYLIFLHSPSTPLF